MDLDPDQAHALSDALFDGQESHRDSGRERPRYAPKQVGEFRVQHLLGVGGMGEVYAAEHVESGQRAAVKIIRADLVSQATSRRFAFEADILAKLRHPGIAALLEAGQIESGHGLRPYFAMELIEGIPLTRHARNMSIRRKLGLFLRACSPVEHAHRRGVIHRDLKPANILVDQTGRPRVLDFGIARATDADVQAPTVVTDFGQILGTLPYMSPEQVSGDPDLIDTRSDVYSMGVVLYELLSGRKPFDLKNVVLPDAIRTIREVEPPFLGTMDRGLRGDLDTIVRTAMHKERDRRYQSVWDLAQDVRRFLNSEPIVARRPSLAYQVSRFVDRHRVLVAVSAAAVVVLVMAVAISTWLALQLSGQIEAFKEYEDLTARQLLDAESRLDASRVDARLSEAVSREVVGVVQSAASEDRPVVEALRDLGRAADAVFMQWPDAALLLRGEVGRMLDAMDESELADPIFEEAMVRAPLCGLVAQRLLTETLAATGREQDAIAIGRRMVDQADQQAGGSPQDVVEARRAYAAGLVAAARFVEAEQLLLDTHTWIEELRGADDRATEDVVRSLIEMYSAWQRPTLAASWRVRLNS